MWFYKRANLKDFFRSHFQFPWVLIIVAFISSNTILADEHQDIQRLLKIELPLAEFVWADEASSKLIGLFHANTASEERGAIVIAHDISQHYASVGLVVKAHQEWTQKGWHVMSVALPALPKSLINQELSSLSAEAEQSLLTYKQQAFDQLIKAFGHVRGLNSGKIILVVQGQIGIIMTGLVHAEQSQPDGLVLIDVVAKNSATSQLLAKQVSELTPAILDIFTNGSSWVKAEKLRRQKTSEVKRHFYRQSSETGRMEADSQQYLLLDRINGWLKRLSDNTLHLSQPAR
jgi:hypothetical protein